MTGLSSGEGDGPGQRRWFHPSELPADPASPEPRTATRPWVSVILGAGLVGALGGFGMTLLLDDDAPSSSRSGTGVASTMRTLQLPHAGDVAQVASKVSSAVVPVAAWSGSTVRRGSGVVYRSDGLVVTSAAVIDGATTVEIELPDGDVAAAAVAGIDTEYDLAVLRVATSQLEPLSFSNEADRATSGQPCFVLGAGSDAQDGPWAAGGVVNATGRVVKVAGHWMIDVLEIQSPLETNAAGGAVVDTDGVLLGVMTSLVEQVRSELGPQALVVPANRARRSVEQILNLGTPAHAWLGLAAVDATEPVRGALVREVNGSGPAAFAGIEPSDVVVGFGGKDVVGMNGLMREVRRREVGESVTVAIVRDGQHLEVTVTLAPRP